MDADPHTQRLYDAIDLVPRVGDRGRGELCVMSLVALLAGERHGDRPETACPVIAAYAIKINDAIDCSTRQRLKPFAPRILGTNDGLGAARAWLLARACLDEAVPMMFAEAGADTARLPGLPRRPDPGLDIAGLSDAIAARARAAGLPRGRIADIRYLLRACTRDAPALVASAAAVLIVDAANAAPDARGARRYLALALDLVDRLCDVGAVSRPPQRLVEAAEVSAATRARQEAVYAPAAGWLKRRLSRPGTAP